MNTLIKILLIKLYFFSTLLANDTFFKVKKPEYINSNIHNGKIILSIESNDDIKGLQFDIIYNPKELFLSESQIASKIIGVDIFSRIKEEGLVTVVMFSMSGYKILDITSSNFADIMEINFEPVNIFNGTTQFKLDDITVAGKGGEQINSVSNMIFDVSYFMPQKTSISNNYPNPFNSSTAIDYQLSKAGIISIVIYDFKGTEVKMLVNKHQEATYYNILWDGINNNGKPVVNGHYVLKMTAPGFTDTISMTLLK